MEIISKKFQLGNITRMRSNSRECNNPKTKSAYHQEDTLPSEPKQEVEEPAVRSSSPLRPPHRSFPMHFLHIQKNFIYVSLKGR